jgi:hypothetical protein
MNLKLDKETRDHFGKLETLKQIDDLDMVTQDLVEDISTLFFELLDTRLRESAKKHGGWAFQRDQSSNHRYWGLAEHQQTKTVRVEFGFLSREMFWSCLPTRPWLGVWTDASKARRGEMRRLTSAFCPRAEKEEDEFPIFEFVEPWPDLEDGDWQDLHTLTHDECRSSVDAIVEQIASVVDTLDQKAAGVGRPGPAKRPRVQRRKSK